MDGEHTSTWTQRFRCFFDTQEISYSSSWKHSSTTEFLPCYFWQDFSRNFLEAIVFFVQRTGLQFSCEELPVRQHGMPMRVSLTIYNVFSVEQLSSFWRWLSDVPSEPENTFRSPVLEQNKKPICGKPLNGSIVQHWVFALVRAPKNHFLTGGVPKIE